MTQKDKLKLMLLGKSNPQLALLSFMEQTQKELKEKMELELKLVKEEMSYELARAIEDLKKKPMEAVLERVQQLKGDKGDEGYTPKYGVDYFTDEDLDGVVESIMAEIPIPKNGVDGEKGGRGDRGETGASGRDGKDGTNGLDGINGMDGKNGKDAKEVDIEPIKNELIEYLNKKLKTVQGGKKGGGMGNIMTQSFAVSSATTSITLSNGVASGGKALWFNYQGQQQQWGVHFTSTGGANIPLLFTPADGTYIDVIFIRG